MLACACDEDLGPSGGPGDLTTASLPDPGRIVKARVVVREAGVVAGLALFPMMMEAYRARFPDRELTIDVHIGDGGHAAAGDAIATLCGAMDLLLAVERPLLNLLGRLGGIATQTGTCVQAIVGTRAVVCDTRKTTPGLRAFEKYAVACGGGTLHRFGLFDAALYKDNHLAALGGGAWDRELAAAIARARQRGAAFVEVEVDTPEQLDRVLAIDPGAPDLVLLDNFALRELRGAVARRDRAAPGVLLEASGGITPATIRSVAETGVDRISVGALTHSVITLDIGLDCFAD